VVIEGRLHHRESHPQHVAVGLGDRCVNLTDEYAISGEPLRRAEAVGVAVHDESLLIIATHTHDDEIGVILSEKRL
jgi:hypothetical protein